MSPLAVLLFIKNHMHAEYMNIQITHEPGFICKQAIHKKNLAQGQLSSNNVLAPLMLPWALLQSHLQSNTARYEFKLLSNTNIHVYKYNQALRKSLQQLFHASLFPVSIPFPPADLIKSSPWA